MTTLAVDTPRNYEIGERNDLPVIASDIIYEGAAAGIVDGTGHARPLVGGDRFVGFAEHRADNSAGSAADITVHLVKKGQVQIAVTGAVITDVGQPVYATDDAAFGFTPVGATFVSGVLLPPPVGALADALAASGELRAAPLLAKHLNDPANSAQDVAHAARALIKLATPRKVFKVRCASGVTKMRQRAVEYPSLASGAVY